jgi:hypothetical protein
MKGFIKRLLREGLLDEVSDELYAKIKSNYHNDRIIVSKDESLSFDVNTIGQQELRRKPKGLWYGIGDSWIKWVKSGMPNWDHKNVYRLDIDDSKMKVIRNYGELIAFDREYGTKETYNGDRMIDWVKVAEKFSGIEIAPFIFEGHMNIEWYYGWDVASGCIWSSGVINKVEKLSDGLDDSSDKTFYDGGKSYKMDIRKDKFIHFTSKDNVDKILNEKKLKSDNSIFGVSAIWGKYSKWVLPKDTDNLVAIYFTTDTKPKTSYPEEVIWGGPVNLLTVEQISYDDAINILKKTRSNSRINTDDEVKYY